MKKEKCRLFMVIYVMVFVFLISLGTTVFACEGEGCEDKSNHPKDIRARHTKEKPSHWTLKQWRRYKAKRQNILRHQKEETFLNYNSTNRNYNMAQGTGHASAGISAAMGAVDAQAHSPAVMIVGVTGDGLAVTAGSLAQGKSFSESSGGGVTKTTAFSFLSKACLGARDENALKALATASKQTLKNQMPPSDITIMSGHQLD